MDAFGWRPAHRDAQSSPSHPSRSPSAHPARTPRSFRISTQRRLPIDARRNRVLRVRRQPNLHLVRRHLPRQVPVQLRNVGFRRRLRRPRSSFRGRAGLPSSFALRPLRFESLAHLRLSPRTEPGHPPPEARIDTAFRVLRGKCSNASCGGHPGSVHDVVDGLRKAVGHPRRKPWSTSRRVAVRP
jgi:hypothetical protein